MSIAPGERIGRYEILEELGRGAMGEVWKARDTKMFGELRAIKVLSDRLSNMEQARSRFTREVQTVAKLRHPNIVTIYDWGEQEGRPFFVMEFLEGVNLSDIVGRKEAMPFREKLQIGIQMCGALEYAHSQRVIHRDVKPGNIMIVQQGRQLLVKLVDFGIVHVEKSNLTHAQTQPGTYSYMSPEQLRNDDIDHRSDLFSLGIVLYELFAGVHPFQAQSEMLISSRILNEGAESLLERQPKLPSALDGLVLELLEKDPNQRPGSADKVGESLNVIMMDWSPTEGSGTDPSTRDLDDRKRRAVKGFEDDARRYESAGSLDRALEAWKLALALAPDSRRIRGKIEALEHRLASESRLRDYLRKAGEALESGDLQTARNHYRDAWVIRPDHPEVAEFKERMSAAESEGSRTAAAPDAAPVDRERDRFVRERLDSAQSAMEDGQLDDARTGLVEILHRYPDEMLAQVLLERCIQAQTVPGLDFGAYRKALRGARDLLENGEPARARDAAEQAGEIWKDDAEWKELRQQADDAVETRGRDLLRRAEGLLRDADRLSDDPEQALGLVREAGEALDDAGRLGFAPDEIEAPRREVDNLRRELEERAEKRRRAGESREREISTALQRGRDRREEGDRLVGAGPDEFSRARETYRQAREAFRSVLDDQPDHLEALDGVEVLDRSLKDLEVRIREHETAAREIVDRLAEAKRLVERADSLVHGSSDDLERCLRLLDDAATHLGTVRDLDPGSNEARRVDEQLETLRARARRGVKKEQDDARKLDDGIREAREILSQAEGLTVARDVAALERGADLCRRGERAAGRVLAVDASHEAAREILDRLGGLREHFRSEIQRREDEGRKTSAHVAEVGGLLDRAERLLSDPADSAPDDAEALLDQAGALVGRHDLDADGAMATRIEHLRNALDDRRTSPPPESSESPPAPPKREPAPAAAEARPRPKKRAKEAPDLQQDLELARKAFRRAKKAQGRAGAPSGEIRKALLEASDRLRHVLDSDPSHDEANRAIEKVGRWLERLDRREAAAASPATASEPKPKPRAAPEPAASRRGLWVGVGGAAVVIVAVVLGILLWPEGEGPPAPVPADRPPVAPSRDPAPESDPALERLLDRAAEHAAAAVPDQGLLEEDLRLLRAAREEVSGSDLEPRVQEALAAAAERLQDAEERDGLLAEGRELLTSTSSAQGSATVRRQIDALRGRVASRLDESGEDPDMARLARDLDDRRTALASAPSTPSERTPPPPPPRPEPWQSDFDALVRDLDNLPTTPPDKIDGSKALADAALDVEAALSRIRAFEARYPTAGVPARELRPRKGALAGRLDALRDREVVARQEEVDREEGTSNWAGFTGTACDPTSKLPAADLIIFGIEFSGRESRPATSRDEGAYRLIVEPGTSWQRILVRNESGAERAYPVPARRISVGQRFPKALCPEE